MCNMTYTYTPTTDKTLMKCMFMLIQFMLRTPACFVVTWTRQNLSFLSKLWLTQSSCVMFCKQRWWNIEFSCNFERVYVKKRLAWVWGEKQAEGKYKHSFSCSVQNRLMLLTEHNNEQCGKMEHLINADLS